ncbi:MAG: RiPP maturation radical SAM C-methyltransferase, partial [Desulfobacterales bacterium]|nr:RiPP maturation radical SAM C-methyltransferase [Desulfobacterales bacterium]
MKIALLSTPWPLFNRPSIQLGALKAFQAREVPAVKVDAHHLYLTVAEALGYETYRVISESTWLSEACYAALLYPEREEGIRRFWRRQSKGLARKLDFPDVRLALKGVTDRILGQMDWEAYVLVGLSICLGQLTSAVYFAREIKRRASALKIVVGGSACSGEMGRTLLRAFPEIDFAVSGEGERPLVHLVKRILQDADLQGPDPIPTLIDRYQDPAGREGDFDQVSDLDQLPVPDYTGYFGHLKTMGAERRFFPTLPVEMSRGCWWQKTGTLESHKGCAFCNLNIQWNGYRAKSQERMVGELEALAEKHEILSLSFMDNLLPRKDLEGLFRRIAGLGKDLRLFAEIRAATPFAELPAMAEAGMEEVQVGIEALSSRLLKKLNKGTTALDNLEMMKNCEAPNLPDLAANLILNFPGSDRIDVDETLKNLEFALPFRPLKPTPFWLGYGSPVWTHSKAFGLKKVFNHPHYARLFPPEVLDRLVLMIQGYHGGLRRQQRLWRPVRQAIEGWKKSYLRLHESPGSRPILSYQEGGDFLIIRQRRYGKDDMTHRLKETSRKIFLFCRENHSISEILGHFPGFGEEKVLPFLNMMVGKKLMFKEGTRYLSLAVPLRGYGRAGLDPQ